MSLSVSTSRLSNWTTTRSTIVARSIGAMSMSGAAVTSMPPEWIERWRGKPSIRAQNSSQRSQSRQADRRAAAGLRRRLRLDRGRPRSGRRRPCVAGAAPAVAAAGPAVGPAGSRRPASVGGRLAAVRRWPLSGSTRPRAIGPSTSAGATSRRGRTA